MSRQLPGKSIDGRDAGIDALVVESRAIRGGVDELVERMRARLTETHRRRLRYP